MFHNFTVASAHPLVTVLPSGDNAMACTSPSWASPICVPLSKSQTLIAQFHEQMIIRCPLRRGWMPHDFAFGIHLMCYPRLVHRKTIAEPRLRQSGYFVR